MPKYALNEVVQHLRQELTFFKVKAREVGNGFEALCIEMEVIKLDAL